ncbi:MAG TPA: zinc ABC transporter substrate-binding protein [Geminicoccus sp.]|uniref:metal ABC transporter solute-binding protein, Zn/Mn family n=1 Tax=Geminicoccus sp. TaxID=2024832 RepID=UPI002E308667|nr:zinc ABC transporter substrate-binding protein [Geminicoccus sp.]HEX2525594.1 zinc ABC transporter substrate-binding protein [Geminicoccus sp.]
MLLRRSFLLVATALPFIKPVSTGAAARPKVVATTAMLGEPLRRITGDTLDWQILMGEGVDPHLFRPTRRDIASLAGADAIVVNGLHLEAKLTDTIERFSPAGGILVAGEHVPGDALLQDATGAVDPHVWMDPGIWPSALEGVLAKLASLQPDGADAWSQSSESFCKEAEVLTAWAIERVASIPPENRLLVTSHDAFGYFSRRLGLEVMAIQGISTESEAGLARIQDVVAALVERKVPAVFIESSVSERAMGAVIEGAAARGHHVSLGGTLFADAMGQPGTHEGSWLGMIDHDVTTIVRALRGQAPERGFWGRLRPAQA